MENIKEVRILPHMMKSIKKEKPLSNSETIRVYHGFNNPKDAVLAATQGLSGQALAKRIYSYESNNNPRGLFVTTDIKTAKNFTNTHGVAIVMEFHVKVKDLEAPVWPSGGYTGYGGYSQYFKDNEDREQARLRDRNIHSKSRLKAISDSDQPELADSLLNSPEMQALFVGHLNANMIRAFWVAEPNADGHQTYKNRYTRMSCAEFLKKYESSIKLPDDGWKLFKPNDNFDETAFYQKIEDKWKLDKAEAKSTFKYLASDESQLLQYVWPKQLPDFKKSLEV